MSSSPSSAFPPEFRLHYPWEYRRFFERSEVFRLRECVIFRIPNELGHFRVGITVKARCNSVQRNRMKRRIRESFRRLQSTLGSYDYNVVVPGSKKSDHPYPLKLARCLMEEFALAVSRRP